MRYLVLLIPFLFVGCMFAGTEVKVDPEAKTLHFKRPWLGGPVSFTGKIKTPEGLEAEWTWESDVNLDVAGSVAIEQQKAVNAALELANNVVGTAGAVAGVPTP